MCVCVGVCGCAVCGCVVCVVWVAHISIVKTKKLRFFRIFCSNPPGGEGVCVCVCGCVWVCCVWVCSVCGVGGAHLYSKD